MPPRRASLLVRLIAFVALVLGAIGLGSTMLVVRTLRQQADRAARDRAATAGQTLRERIEADAELLRVQASSIADAPVARAILGSEDLDVESRAIALAELMAGYQLAGFRVLDPDGRVLAEGPAGAPPESLAGLTVGLGELAVTTSGDRVLLAAGASAEIRPGYAATVVIARPIDLAAMSLHGGGVDWALRAGPAPADLIACGDVAGAPSLLRSEVTTCLVAGPWRSAGHFLATIASDVGALRATVLVTSGSTLVGVVVVVVLLWLLLPRWVRPVTEATARLAAESRGLIATARSQEASIAQQAAAVSQTSSTMEELLDAAERIAASSRAALSSAERAALGADEIRARIAELDGRADRIGEILESIRGIADRSELLALNAALEGSRAGEAGRGFVLVAVEVRKVAEAVAHAVADVRALMQAIGAASRAAVVAAAEGSERASEVTASARDIASVAVRQRDGTGVVSDRMSEMGSLIEHNLEAMRQLSGSAARLEELGRAIASVMR